MKYRTFLIISVALLHEADAAGESGKNDNQQRNGQGRLGMPNADNNRARSTDTFFIPRSILNTDAGPEQGHRALDSAIDHHDIASAIRNGKTTESRADDGKKEAKKEKLEKVKALRAAENDGSPYKLTLKASGKKTDVGIVHGGQIETNIVGGDQSDVGEFPYYVDMGDCGGTLIAPGVILGAAHCGELTGHTVYVSGYEHGTATFGAIPVRIVSQAQHPDYNMDTFENDFALYQLEEEIFLDTQVTVSLNDDATQPFDGQYLTVLGLGKLATDGGHPTFLNDVVVSTVSSDYCASSESYGSQFNADVMFCAGDSSADSCQGDSGGPIVIQDGNNHILVGVVSWGAACADPTYPGIYARVSSAIPWIKSVVCDSWNMNGDFCGESSSPSEPTGDCVTLALDFRTDEYSEETSVLVQNSQQEILLYASSFQDNTEYHYETCIEANGCAMLQFNDVYGDGLNGGGYLRVTWGDEVIFDDWEFGYGFEHEFSTGGCASDAGVVSTLTRTETVSLESCVTLTVELRTDHWPEETHLLLKNDLGNIWDFSGFDPDTKYFYTSCIPNDKCISLDVTDLYGDGLLNDGYIRVTLGSTILYDDWNIGYGFVLDMGEGCPN